MTDRGRPTASVALPPLARPEDRGGSERYAMAMVVGLTAVVIYLFIFLSVLVRQPYDVWAGYAFAPVLFGIGLLLLRRFLPRVEEDGWVRTVVMVGLGAKLLGGFARYYVNEYILGLGDAYGYYLRGSLVAAEFRQFVFGGPAFEQFVPDLTGTRFMNLVTALVYTITGSTHLGGYIVFSFMSFWGLYLFYRAYCIAVPDGLRRRYAVLVFLLPSVVFWPSSIGKEAWLTTMLGLGSYGLARLLAQLPVAYPPIFLAMAGMTVVRPHVGAIFGLSMAVAFVLRRSSGQGATTRKILGLLVLAVAAGVLINQLQAFFGLDSALDARAVFDETTRRSSQGGSQFEVAQPTSLAGVPWAVVTVMFRPFLFEAGSAAGLVTALEGTLLMGLFVWNAPRLARLPVLMVSNPYLGYATIYSLVFAFSFSAVGNFGILARQRTQLFPIVVILLTSAVISSPRIAGANRRIDLPALRLSRVVGEPEPTVEEDDDEATESEEATQAAQPRYRNLSYQTVHTHHGNQRAEADGGHGERGPTRGQDPLGAHDQSSGGS